MVSWVSLLRVSLSAFSWPILSQVWTINHHHHYHHDHHHNDHLVGTEIVLWLGTWLLGRQEQTGCTRWEAPLHRCDHLWKCWFSYFLEDSSVIKIMFRTLFIVNHYRKQQQAIWLSWTISGTNCSSTSMEEGCFLLIFADHFPTLTPSNLYQNIDHILLCKFLPGLTIWCPETSRGVAIMGFHLIR